MNKASVFENINCILIMNSNFSVAITVNHGDGSQSESFRSIGANIQTVFNHTYSKDGTYSIVLKITNINPTYTWSETIQVFQGDVYYKFLIMYF